MSALKLLYPESIQDIQHLKLKASDDLAFNCYEKLNNYLAISQNSMYEYNEPFERKQLVWKNRNIVISKRTKIEYWVGWMPKLKDGFRRMTYEEFCIWYNIELI